MDYCEIKLQSGHYFLVFTSDGLAYVSSPGQKLKDVQKKFSEEIGQEKPEIVSKYENLFKSYFNQKLIKFDIKLDITRGTIFQQQVWRYLLTIPYGTVQTYQQVASGIGRPDAIRATASAIARNPLLIVIPCHRVMRKDGGLGGYRGGLDLKRKLQILESNINF